MIGKVIAYTFRSATRGAFRMMGYQLRVIKINRTFSKSQGNLYSFFKKTRENSSGKEKLSDCGKILKNLACFTEKALKSGSFAEGISPKWNFHPLTKFSMLRIFKELLSHWLKNIARDKRKVIIITGEAELTL